MALVLGDRVLDNGLSALDTEADKIFVCSALPTTYTEATSTYALGNKNFGAGSAFAAPAAASPGRKTQSVAITDGSVTANGTVSHWAAVDTANSRLLATDVVSGGAAVTSGQQFTLASFAVQMSGQTATSATAFDPAKTTSGITLSNSNLTATHTSAGGGGWTVAGSVSGASSGKKYFEVTIGTISTTTPGWDIFGFANATYLTGGVPLGNIGSDHAVSSDSAGYACSGSVIVATGTAGTIQTATTGDTVGIALDIDAKLIWVKNITQASNWNNDAGANPATGANGISVSATNAGPYYAAINAGYDTSTGDALTANFGGAAYAIGTAPSGFGNW